MGMSSPQEAIRWLESVKDWTPYPVVPLPVRNDMETWSIMLPDGMLYFSSGPEGAFWGFRPVGRGLQTLVGLNIPPRMEAGDPTTIQQWLKALSDHHREKENAFFNARARGHLQTLEMWMGLGGKANTEVKRAVAWLDDFVRDDLNKMDNDVRDRVLRYQDIMLQILDEGGRKSRKAILAF